MNNKIKQEAMHLHNWCTEQCDCVHCDFGRDNRTCKISGIPATWFDDEDHSAAAGNMADEGWINIKDRPPKDGQLAAILTVFRGTTPGRMVARYLPKRFPNNPWTLMHGEIVYYWAPLPEVPGKEWEDVINGETVHKN
nr:MAG TPA: Protein of unknown function (DUF551) [Caudoviricetes sp.]